MTVSRVRLPLVLSALIFVVACAHTTRPAIPDTPPVRPAALVEQPAGCPPLVNRLEAPIVCVDDTGEKLVVSPETIYAYDRHPEDKTPINVLWFTRSGSGDLRIEMKDDSCLGKVWCNPRTGHCRAKTLPLNGKTQSEPCKYDVWIEGGKQERLDPFVVVRQCC